MRPQSAVTFSFGVLEGPLTRGSSSANSETTSLRTSAEAEAKARFAFLLLLATTTNEDEDYHRLYFDYEPCQALSPEKAHA